MRNFVITSWRCLKSPVQWRQENNILSNKALWFILKNRHRRKPFDNITLLATRVSKCLLHENINKFFVIFGRRVRREMRPNKVLITRNADDVIVASAVAAFEVLIRACIHECPQFWRIIDALNQSMSTPGQFSWYVSITGSIFAPFIGIHFVSPKSPLTVLAWRTMLLQN
jgi:MFS superfamily sulfate permease-like transporter